MKQLVFNQSRWAMKNIEIHFLSLVPIPLPQGSIMGIVFKEKNTHLSIKWPEIQEEVDIFHERAWNPCSGLPDRCFYQLRNKPYLNIHV